MHHAVADDNLALKLWDTVKHGLHEYEHHKMRPYLTLFFYLVNGASQSPYIASQVEGWLSELFRKTIYNNQRYFQWMEVMIDFIWKLYTRVPFVRVWLQNRHELWEQLIGDWLDQNREPPQQYANKQNAAFVMNKSRPGKLNAYRFEKQKNLILHYYRATIFNHMRNNTVIDLSQDIDLDAVCVQDYKFC